MIRFAVATLVAVVALGGCSTITTFNTLAPKDPSVRVVQSAAFGDNPRQKLDIYAPYPRVQNAPVLVFFYGGSWSGGRRQDYEWAARALASRGFLTVIPDYRLYPEVRYPDFLTDGAQAIRWAVDHAAEYGGDPARIVLAGHSAGGYNAIQLALDASHLKAAGVDPKRIKGAVGLAGPYDFLPLDVADTINAFGQYPDLPATQPVNHARADAPPILLLHGGKDTVVGPYHTENLAKRLRAVGAPVQEKIYPAIGHTRIVLQLSQPFRGEVLEDVARFVKQAAGA